jgi:hypothetical protein
MNDIEMADKDGNIRGALVGFKHTGGPWHFIEGTTCLSIQGDRGETILLDTSPEKNREQKIADYQRIVACVNACEGLSQFAFDGGWTAKGMSKYANQLEGRLALVDAPIGLKT